MKKRKFTEHKKITLAKIGLLIILIISFVYVSFFNVPRGIVSLTFDDGYENFYNIAYPIMKDYNYTGTVYLITNWSGDFEERKLMNFSEAKILQSNGWEIGSHTLNHKRLSNLSDKEIAFELSESKKLLKENGFEVNSLSLPFGDYSENIDKIAKKDYSSIRLMKAGYNSLVWTDNHHLISNQVKLEDNAPQICLLIDDAIKNRKWVIINFHFVDYNESKIWDVSVDDFKEILDCINRTGVQVMNVNSVVKKYGKK